MVLTSEQSQEIKKILFEQLEHSNQKDKEVIKEYIKNLNEEQLEEFLKKNNIKIAEKKPTETCIFCEIAKGKIPVYKISENKDSIAILEINPLSKAHTLIIPINHIPIEKIPKTLWNLTQKITKKIKKKLKPEDIKIETSNIQGHSIINIIPIYKNLNLKRTNAKKEELEDIQKKLTKKLRNQITKKEKPKKDFKEKIQKINFRIP